MQGENPPNHILIYTGAERQVDLLGNSWRTPVRIALFHFNDCADDVSLWTLWPWFPPVLWRK
jgi:hypothetical protein